MIAAGSEGDNILEAMAGADTCWAAIGTIAAAAAAGGGGGGCWTGKLACWAAAAAAMAASAAGDWKSWAPLVEI